MAEFMPVRQREIYNVRRDIEERDCKSLLRFESRSVVFLVAEFLEETDSRGGGISRRQQMEVFLRYVGDPGFQSGAAQDLGVHRSTANKTISYVLNRIVDRSHNWIKFPTTAATMNDAKVLWQRRFRLPTVIGALDCTQIEITKPRDHGDEYICRKGYASINVQATCNALEQFTSINAEWPGSVHDSRVWRNSGLRDIVSQFDGSACLLGDSGFGGHLSKMLTNQPSLNAAYGALQWPYGSTSRHVDQRSSLEQEIVSQNSPASRPLSSTASSANVLTNPSSMLHVSAGGFGMPHIASPTSSSYSPRPILGCNDWHVPSTNSPSNHIGSPIDSPTGSNSSTFSSLDISDLMSSLSLSPPRRLFPASTEQEMANLRALHNLSSNSMLHTASALSPPPHLGSPQLDSNRPWSLADITDNFNRAGPFNRTQPSTSFEGTVSWSGELPQRLVLTPTFSCKVFLGGVPWDVTEETLILLFMQYGRIRVEWPGKENSASQPKGYVYLIFETENQVKMLLNSCSRDFSNGNSENYYFRIYSRKMKYKAVQVIPWRLSDSNYVLTPSEKLDPHTTVFVGGLHGMVSAEGLYKIMNDLFDGVIYVGIDTDKYKYPIGSARVTFNNRRSYIKAVMAAFIEIKTSKFVKKVQVDPYLEDAVCSNCVIHPGPYFCRQLCCFRYFCPGCWMQQHQYLLGHRPLVRTSKYNNSNASSPHIRLSHH